MGGRESRGRQLELLAALQLALRYARAARSTMPNIVNELRASAAAWLRGGGLSLCAPKIGEILSGQNILPKTSCCCCCMAHAAYTQSAQFFLPCTGHRAQRGERGSCRRRGRDRLRTAGELPITSCQNSPGPQLGKK